MSVDYIAVAMGEAITIPPEYVRSSIEHVDGSEVHLEVWWPLADIPRLWVTSRFTMPSGRHYTVNELRWGHEDDGGYVVHVYGRAATD